MADHLFQALSELRVGTFFYGRRRIGFGPMLNQHADVYGKACLRIYLLREESFDRKFTSFELRCGQGRGPNLIIPMAENVRSNVPNSHLFIFEEGWNWLPAWLGEDWPAIVERVLDYTRHVA
jgi:hypothetical protein